MLALLPTDGSDPLVRIGEAPEPEPGPHEAVVTVEAFSINRGETFQLERPRDGWRPGKDIAGHVVTPAPDGSGPRAGQRVVGHTPRAGWAQRTAVPTDALAALPDAIETATAAALPLAGLTALGLLRGAGPLAGRRALLTGASGGVGHYLTELASSIGTEITAVTASPERAERLIALGAARVVHRVADARGPFDVAFESIGGQALAAALSLLVPHGRVIWFGQAGLEPARLDFFEHFDQTGATVRHFHYEDSDVPVSRDLATLVRLVAAGRLHPEIGLVDHWSRTAQALTDLRGRRIRGNAVLMIPNSTNHSNQERT
jgi:NADPH2:quinone reductase